MSETGERLAVQGPRGPQGRQGNQGNRGEHGVTGLSPAVRRALVFLFALSVILSVAGLFWNARQVNDCRAANHRQNQVTEEKICTAVNGLVVLMPPAGNPAHNPARAQYDQELHAAVVQLLQGLDAGTVQRDQPGSRLQVRGAPVFAVASSFFLAAALFLDLTGLGRGHTDPQTFIIIGLLCLALWAALPGWPPRRP